MSTAETPAVVRPRLQPPGGGHILTRGVLALMLAQLEASARPRLQAEGAAAATGDTVTYALAARSAQAALTLRARQLRSLIPGRARVITRQAFAAALRAFAAELGFPLQVDGADRLLEDADGGIALRLPPVADIFVFMQIERFDSLTGNVLRDVALSASLIRATGIFTTTSEWQFTQMLNQPENDPPRTRTIAVSYWVRYRAPGGGGMPEDLDSPGLFIGPAVVLGVRKWDQDTFAVIEETAVLIDDPGGVLRNDSTTPTHPRSRLSGISLSTV